MHVNLKGSFKKAKKITGLRAQYLYYCYLLGVLPKNKQRHEPLLPTLKTELTRLNQYTDQIRLLWKYRIDTDEQLKEFIFEREMKIQFLIIERNKVYNILRRCNDLEKIKALKIGRDSISAQLVKYRKEIKTANGVLDNTDNIRKNIKLTHEVKISLSTKYRIKDFSYIREQ